MKNVFIISVGLALVLGARIFKKRQTSVSVVDNLSPKVSNSNSSDCSGPIKSFANDVNPIIPASCSNRSGCHGNGSSNGPGPLLNYTQVFNARSSIQSAVSSGNMPLNGSLTASQKNAILCWIANGATNS